MASSDTAGTAGAAGYSGTPLAKKLGVKPGHLVVLNRAPAGWQIPDLPHQAAVRRRTAPQEATADITVVFCRSRRQLERDAAALTAALATAGALWIAWPRRAAGHSSDITESGLRDLLLPFGIVDVKVAALDNDWSALKFVWRKSRRGAHRGTA